MHVPLLPCAPACSHYYHDACSPTITIKETISPMTFPDAEPMGMVGGVLHCMG